MRIIKYLWLPVCTACLIQGAIPAPAAIVPGSSSLGAIWYIGDSITQGNADQDPNGYTVRSTLYNYLTAAGYTFTYTGHFTANTNGLPITGGDPSSDLYQYHSGVSGAVIGTNYSGRTGITQNIPGWWTTSSSRLDFVRPNVILIMIGANDANLSLDITNAPGRLAQLISTIYAQPGVGNPTILVSSITPDRANPAAVTNVTLFNAAVPGVVQQYQHLGDDVYMVDQFTALNNNYAATMNTDNLHPNSLGNGYMASNWLAVIQGYVGATVPAPPCGFAAAETNRLVNLSWSVVPGATAGYVLWRSQVEGSGYTVIASNLTAQVFADTNVVNNTAYYYVVTAVNAKGESAQSIEASATPAVLPPPGSLTAITTNLSMTLSWAAVSGATSYVVKRSSTAGGPYGTLAMTANLDYADSNLAIGQAYYYVVSAINASGQSADSPPVAASIVLPTALFIGDDAGEGEALTAGNAQDTLSIVTYAFDQSGSTYTNTSGLRQVIQLTEVNFITGSGGGSFVPFISLYTGGQTSSDVINRLKYDVLLAGDPVAVTANAGLQRAPFFLNGTNPAVVLAPGAVLVAGFVSAGAGIVQFQNSPNGLIDYIYNGNSLPATLGNALTGNSTYSFDRTMKFDVGLAATAQTTNTLASGLNPATYGASVTLTATVSPAPTNGEAVTFMDGPAVLGRGALTNGASTLTTDSLAPGTHSITAIYGGDTSYYSSISAILNQTVTGGAPLLSIYAMAAGQWQISWPPAYLGWLLQAQTNGLGTGWWTIAGTDASNSSNVSVDQTRPAVFYRLLDPH